MRSILLVLWLFAVHMVAQTNEIGAAEKVYKSSEGSVFLVYLNDSDGTPKALGSAFLVAPKLLITNAHVINGGSPVLAVGPVRIPVKVVKLDSKNDLAVLSVDVDLTSRALPLRASAPNPGEQVFAIGNPEGLEKSISQGIVAGLRNEAGRDLLQITSPISHGSSGGPILDSNGQVVGVAVAILENGQNLNFAVPIRFARQLLDAPASADVGTKTSHTAAEVATLLARKNAAPFSTEESSTWQVVDKQLDSILPSAFESATSVSDLTTITCAGTVQEGESLETALAAAMKIKKQEPSPQNSALVAWVWYKKATWSNFLGLLAKEDSEERRAANDTRDKALVEAESAAIAANREAGRKLPLAEFVLGNVKEDRSEYAQAIIEFQQVALTKLEVCGNNLTQDAVGSLVRDTDKAARPAESESWFRKYLTIAEAKGYDWDAEGDRRWKVKDWSVAAAAYENAYAAGTYPVDSCYAAVGRYLQPQTDGDRVLADGRACVTEAAKNTNKDLNGQFQFELPNVYMDMADVLNGRGVYQAALDYAKESLAIRPNEAWGLHVEALIYENMERYQECISTEKAAVAASDGKFPEMLFHLGSCYFDTQSWVLAEQNYRLAANADKSNAGAAFNTGLSLARQGYSNDARVWFEEALRRHPGDELRSKILNAMK